jgi:PKD repeat protein
MLTSPSRGTAAACRAVVAAVCIAAVAAIGAGSAQASSLSLQYEPTYTKGTSNQWYTTQYHSNDDVYYYVCASAGDNGVSIPGEQSNGSNGPGTLNCGGNTAKGTTDTNWALNATTPQYQGHKYEMCLTDYHDWPNPLGGIFWKMQTTMCQWTILDASKPLISTGINGSDEFTKNPSVSVRIDYNDSISPPWNGADGRAANLVCFSQGATCTPADYDANCSVPAAWQRVTSFACGATLPSDGKWYACARSSDRAIPDMRDWSKVNSNQANVSDTACGWITLDRAAPTVTVDAGATTVKVGQLVSFSAQAADGVSGVKGDFAWTFGDNTAAANGATTSHTYTQPGTYMVSATAADGAGNSGSGTKTITVEKMDTGGGTGTGGGGGGTTGGGTGGGGGTTGGGTTGGGGTTTGPTGGTAQTVVKEIVQQGGGSAQATSIGALVVTTAKTVKVTNTLKTLPLALTVEAPGMVRMSLLKGARIVAKGATKLTGAGTFAYRLKLPKASKLKTGAYNLKVSFTPAGQARTVTQTLKVKLIGRKKAGKASVSTFGITR